MSTHIQSANHAHPLRPRTTSVSITAFTPVMLSGCWTKHTSQSTWITCSYSYSSTETIMFNLALFMGFIIGHICIICEYRQAGYMHIYIQNLAHPLKPSGTSSPLTINWQNIQWFRLCNSDEMGSLGVSKQETAPITASVQIHVKHLDKNISKNPSKKFETLFLWNSNICTYSTV